MHDSKRSHSKLKEVDYTVSEFIKDRYFHKWLVDPYLACDEFWNKWMGGDKDKIKVVEEAKNVLLSMDFVEEKLPEVEKEQIWSGINDIIGKPENKKGISWYPLAAAVVLIMVSIAAFFSYTSYPVNDNFNTEIVYIEKFTPQGQKSTIRLADGSLVKLNAGSKIRYPEKFEVASREVYLEGEAFFEVVKDVSRPFIVKSGDIETTVLGTSFNVRAYPELESIDVTGKVEVRNTSFHAVGSAEDIMHLTPSRMATYNRKNGSLKKKTFEAQEVLSWKENIIYFEDADFADIQKVLQKWYGVEFKLERNVKIEKDFSGIFDNRPLRAVMEGLSFSLGFEYVIDESTVIIK